MDQIEVGIVCEQEQVRKWVNIMYYPWAPMAGGYISLWLGNCVTNLILSKFMKPLFTRSDFLHISILLFMIKFIFMIQIIYDKRCYMILILLFQQSLNNSSIQHETVGDIIKTVWIEGKCAALVFVSCIL